MVDPQLCSSYHNIRLSVLETLSINKNINEKPEIEVFLGSNLNFTSRVFTWGLANDNNICKKKKKKILCPI